MFITHSSGNHLQQHDFAKLYLLLISVSLYATKMIMDLFNQPIKFYSEMYKIKTYTCISRAWTNDNVF